MKCASRNAGDHAMFPHVTHPATCGIPTMRLLKKIPFARPHGHAALAVSYKERCMAASVQSASSL